MRTLILCHSLQDSVLEQVKRLLKGFTDFAAPAVTSFESVTQPSFQVGVDLVVVLLTGDQERGEEVITRVRQQFGGHLLAVGGIGDSRAILRSLKVGADVFLDVAELETAFEPAVCKLLCRQSSGKLTGNLLAVVSASGGCGASMLAVNLAALLAKKFEKSILIDLNPGRGDLPALLDLKPQFSLADVCANQARMDRAMLEKLLVPHSSGVRLLAAPAEFADIRAITVSGVRTLLALARQICHDTIIDLEDCFHTEQMEVLRQATEILLVCRLDFTALRHTRRVLDHLGKLDIQRSAIKVVANHQGLPNELPINEAELAIGRKVTAFIPHDPKNLNIATNTGVPVVLKEPQAKVTQALMQIANVDFNRTKESSRLLPSFGYYFRDVLSAALRAQH